MRHPDGYWHALPSGKIQSDLCPPRLQTKRRPTRALLRAPAGSRRDDSHDLRAFKRLLYRPN
jgi:hypothetical protein